MKQLILLLAIFILINIPTYGQSETIEKGKEKLPDSWINVGAGMGMTYGGVGVKTVLGKRNSGLLIGLGIHPETIGYEIGGQLSFNWFYVNVGYGINGTYQFNNGPVERIKGYNINLGGMINLGENKRTFIDLGFGAVVGTGEVSIPTGYGGTSTFNHNDFTAAVGVGYRIGG